MSVTWGITAKWKINHYFISSLASSLQIPKEDLSWKNWGKAIFWAHVYTGSLILLPAVPHQFEIAGPYLPLNTLTETSIEGFTWESQFTEWASRWNTKAKGQTIQRVQTLLYQSYDHKAAEGSNTDSWSKKEKRFLSSMKNKSRHNECPEFGLNNCNTM